MAVERTVAITSLGERAATPNDATPYAKMGRLIAVLRRERDEGNKAEGNYIEYLSIPYSLSRTYFSIVM
jgi:hypothetical protein